jgi:DNA gyrase subunit A
MIQQLELKEALREYYMPYAMKVITDRALPDVRDGLKPIARKILWTLWNNGVKDNASRDKSGKIVGDILRIHNHGDSSVYMAMSLLTEQNESLLHPFISGEGAFGKVYSNDKPSAMRYTSAKLNKFSEEMFVDINKNTVKFIGEDKSHTQPLVLTNTFPNILVKPNKGLAVGEACNWASFNLKEICELAQAYIKNKSIDIHDYIQAPDFSTGGYIIISENEMDKIFNTGKGSFKLRGKYKYNQKENIIEIYEIPYNSTVDDIIKDINILINKGIIKDVADVKDDTGFNKILKKEVMGIRIELRRNANVDILMSLLFKKTRLETSFNCNFNCLVDYKPKTLGLKAVLDEWIKFRFDCIRNAMIYDINEKQKVLHYLKGLEKVLLDIDEAISIIRNSENDDMIITNLMQTFKIDESQANEISNMKLKNINQKYILNKIKSIVDVNTELEILKTNVDSEAFISKTIANQLEMVKNKYSKERKSEILYKEDVLEVNREDLIEDYTTTMVLTKEQYIKKTLKYSDKQTTKEGDEVLQIIQTTNKKDILLFTSKGRLFTRKIYELEGKIECTASGLGEYIPNIIKDLYKEEKVIYIASPETYDKGYMLYIFENNSIVKMNMKPYENKQNRKVAQDAYNPTNKLKHIKCITDDIDMFITTNEGKSLILNTNQFNPLGTGGKKSLGNSFIKLDSKKFDDNSIVSIILEPKADSTLNIITEKKEFELKLNDLADNGKMWFEYLQGNKNNTGSFIYNCRQKNDRVIDVKLK